VADELVVRDVIKGKELYADPMRIALGDVELATDAIDQVAYFSEFHAGAASRLDRVTLWAGSQSLVINYVTRGRTAPMHPTVARIIPILETIVLPRIAAEMVGRIFAGEILNVGPLKVSREGLSGRPLLRTVTLPWEAIEGWTPRAGLIVFFRRDNSGKEISLDTRMSYTNAVVLPAVLTEMRSRLGLPA